MTVPTDISLRDYFAGQALTGLMARPPMPYGEAAWLAYGHADRMLAKREKDGKHRDHEIEELTRRAETAETSLEILRGEIARLEAETEANHKRDFR
jgi:hypothetical protein